MSIYQLCLWLCKNSSVLQLANNMHLSIQTPVVEGSQFMPFTFSGSSTTLQSQGDKIKANHNFLEELKCLFLRVRNPRKGAFEELQIDTLVTFRNSLVNNVMDLISDFKVYNRALQKEEIFAFVDESATTYVLNRWLNTTNINELKAQNSMHHLCRFI
ncbi:hypothetical protein C2G38_2029473 [Gigaspora rosea]|uniref:Uncharacterized protein n=1 Tax=Gigaspora rosea TaxID=44941 RepID=A0A397VZT1_9GLOM|nr:hypothetical protein C2G38_2029473 [Gigaspora rosea]